MKQAHISGWSPQEQGCVGGAGTSMPTSSLYIWGGFTGGNSLGPHKSVWNLC